MSYSNQLSMSDSKDEINTNLYSELSFKSNWFIARTKHILSTVNLEIFSTILKIKIKHELKSPETCLFCQENPSSQGSQHLHHSQATQPDQYSICPLGLPTEPPHSHDPILSYTFQGGLFFQIRSMQIVFDHHMIFQTSEFLLIVGRRKSSSLDFQSGSILYSIIYI